MSQTFNLTVPDGTDISEIAFSAPVKMWLAQDAQLVQTTTNLKSARELLAQANATIAQQKDVLKDASAELDKRLAAKQELIDSAQRTIDSLEKRIDVLVKTPPANPVPGEIEKQNTLLQKEFSAAMQYIQGLHEALEDVFEGVTVSTQTPKMLALYHVWKLTKPPVVVPPVPPLPPAPVVPGVIAATISKQRVANMAQFTITTGDDAPSDAEDNRTRDFMAMGGDIGFNTVRWYANIRQMRKYVELLKLNSPLCIPTFARAHGLTPIIDTADNLALNLSDAELKEYFDSAKLLGYAAACFNDANQYRNEAKFPKGTLERLVKRVRIAAPDMLLFCSVTGSAKVTEYEPLFDRSECQAFGSLNDFKTFLKLPCDWLCIDGRRSATPEYLEAMLDLLLASGKDVFSVYTFADKGETNKAEDDTNWKNQPETVRIYKSFLAKWRAARTKITAQLTELPGS